MKRCPQCGREYDSSMMFCLDDGIELLYGPGSAEEPRTAILTPNHISSEQATRSFGQIPSSGSTSFDSQRHTASKKNSLIAGIVGIVLVTALGIGSYLYYGRGSANQINSIAVLPFQNRSDDADTDYLSDGLAESLIFRLTQLPNLKVSPSSSVMRYKGNETDVAKIAADLGVDAVMTGRLAKRGDNLNITVELVDARNNKSLWGEQYERKMSDLLATQREIAATIAQKLQLKLTGNDQGITKKYTDNNEAYQLWMKGRFHFARRTKDDMQRSIELFKQATELDPKFALAYVGIAESYTTMPSYDYISPAEASPKAQAAIAKALELDPDLPEAHAVAGMIATTGEWDFEKGEREFKRAIELGPNLAISHYRYGWTYLSTVGRHDEAIAEMKRAMELEPLSVQQGSNYAAVLMYARRFDEALEQGKKTYDLDPNHVGARNWLCHAYNAKGLYNEAVAIGEKTKALQPSSATSLFGCLGLAYAKTGQREKALEQIETVRDAGKTRYISNYWIAVIYAGLGNKDAAFHELETAVNNRDWFSQRMKVDPFMDTLRDDPRFEAMVKRLNLPG